MWIWLGSISCLLDCVPEAGGGSEREKAGRRTFERVEVSVCRLINDFLSIILKRAIKEVKRHSLFPVEKQDVSKQSSDCSIECRVGPKQSRSNPR